MSEMSLNLVQSMLLILGLVIAFFGRDYSVDHRLVCRRAFLMFAVLLVFNQFSYRDTCAIMVNREQASTTPPQHRTIVLKAPIQYYAHRRN